MTNYQYNPNLEQWKQIIGFPGYEVSDYGRVRSFWRKIHKGIKGTRSVLDINPQKIIKPYIRRDSRLSIHMRREGKDYNFKVHRLVLLHFSGECPPGHEACHNNGDCADNRFINLRWDFPSSNHADVILHGIQKGIRNPQAKLTESHVKEIRRLSSLGWYLLEISKLFGITPSNVHCIVRRKTWKHI